MTWCRSSLKFTTIALHCSFPKKTQTCLSITKSKLISWFIYILNIHSITWEFLIIYTSNMPVFRLNAYVMLIMLLFVFNNCRLYISYTCPYAQRVWITRNCKVISLTRPITSTDFKHVFFLFCFHIRFVSFDMFWTSILFSSTSIFQVHNIVLEQGLQNKIQLVPINLQDRPSWYKEKVYPPNKVKIFCIHELYLW